jgi:hypothetical protein
MRRFLLAICALAALSAAPVQAQAPVPPRAAAVSGPATLELFADSIADFDPSKPRVARGAFYAASYSSLFAGSGRTRVDFAVTLSIHNVSRDRALVIDTVVYYDTAGRKIETYLDRPVALKPFGTIQFFVSKDDVRGGTGANFVVEWSSEDETVEAPHIETVMIGLGANQSLAFAVPARRIGEPGSR